MPFQKGNKLGAKGRPAGSKNKTTDRNKDVLHELLYNPEDMISSFKTLDAYKQWGHFRDILLSGLLNWNQK